MPLNIFLSVSSASEDSAPLESLHSYYFDAKSGLVLTREEYLDTLGVTPEEVEATYLAEFYPDEADVTLNFDRIPFYFDEDGALWLLFDYWVTWVP